MESSRPLSGLSISQFHTDVFIFVPYHSSRPLSGLSISQLKNLCRIFPQTVCSRPLSGLSISQSYEDDDYGRVMTVLVPSRGYLYLNCMCALWQCQ